MHNTAFGRNCLQTRMCCSFSELPTNSSSSHFGSVEDFLENTKPILPFCSSVTDSSLPSQLFWKIQDNYNTKLGAIKARVKPVIDSTCKGGWRSRLVVRRCDAGFFSDVSGCWWKHFCFLWPGLKKSVWPTYFEMMRQQWIYFNVGKMCASGHSIGKWAKS